MKYHDSKMWDEVYMSDEQLGWLKQNLEEYSQKDKISQSLFSLITFYLIRYRDQDNRRIYKII